MNSIINIKKRNNVNTFYGITKHLIWQVRKHFHLFPFTQQISQSKIIANNQYCSVSALINSSNMGVLSGFEELLTKVSIIFLEINGRSDQRDASENSIRNLLIEEGFIGPMSFNASKNEFYSYQHGLLENPIFINKKLFNGNNEFKNSSLTLNILKI